MLLCLETELWGCFPKDNGSLLWFYDLPHNISGWRGVWLSQSSFATLSFSPTGWFNHLAIRNIVKLFSTKFLDSNRKARVMFNMSWEINSASKGKGTHAFVECWFISIALSNFGWGHLLEVGCFSVKALRRWLCRFITNSQYQWLKREVRTRLYKYIYGIIYIEDISINI